MSSSGVPVPIMWWRHQVAGTVLTSTVSLLNRHSLPSIKQCLEDDVRPTVRPKLASRKIINDILVSQQQSPAAATETINSLWERFALSSVFESCQACGRQALKE
ncbi:hypothetical protein BDB00DRAFT_873294 [Zychaea mexicana]|uniref:uncharacterized protein n=1 Tax=Zychaea mexicana TaxID=64656 RepID=UPI0022FDDC3A|nr:uncharacterized protein BDB00DRAFT_873294 [Zychaea mexicana]KAI9492537.1 hypothetical protein BDB00DRAFT_873294 [Zychaea mexicana]